MAATMSWKRLTGRSSMNWRTSKAVAGGIAAHCYTDGEELLQKLVPAGPPATPGATLPRLTALFTTFVNFAIFATFVKGA